MQTVRRLSQTSGVDRIDARVLLQYVLQVNHAWLIAHDDATLTDQQAHDFRALVARRIAGEPIAYLIGQREFYGLNLTVNKDVLIPRPDTELLVDLALACIPTQADQHIVDLGTGSGAIAIAIAKARPHAQVCATDASFAALKVAQANAARHDVHNITFFQGDWFAAVPNRRFDLIISNPPYIRAHDPHLTQGDLRFEPVAALTDESHDGLAHIRHIILHAPDYLVPSGQIFLEHGFDQSSACQEMLRQRGFKDVKSFDDIAGIARVSRGVWK